MNILKQKPCFHPKMIHLLTDFSRVFLLHKSHKQTLFLHSSGENEQEHDTV